MHHIPSIWKLYRHLYEFVYFIKLKIRLKWDQEHLIYFFHKTKLSSTVLHNAYIRPTLESPPFIIFYNQNMDKTLTQNIMANQMDMLHPVISSHYFSMDSGDLLWKNKHRKDHLIKVWIHLMTQGETVTLWWYYISDDWVQEPGQTGPKINKHCVHTQHCAHWRVPLSMSWLLCL